MVRHTLALLFIVGTSLSCFGQVDKLLAQAKDILDRNTDSSKMVFDQAVAECVRTKDDTTLLKIICDYSAALRGYEENDLSLHYLRLAKTLKSEAALARKFQLRLTREILYLYYNNIQDLDSALHYAKIAVATADDSVDLGRVHNSLGLVYSSAGDMVKALENYNIALAYQQSPRTPPIGRAMVYNNLGILYEDDGDNERAEQWYLKSAEIHGQLDNKEGQFLLWNNLAILYDHQHRYEESLQTMAKAEALVPEFQRPDGQMLVDVNTGNTLVHAGRLEEGVARLKKALAGFERIGRSRQAVNAHRQLAEAYLKLGRYKEAERESFDVIALASRDGYNELIKDAYHDLFDIYEATKDYKNAFKYQSLYLNIQDSLNSRERRSKIGLLEKNYEAAQQAAAQEKLERENELHVVQSRIDSITRMSLTSGLVVVGLVAVGLVVAYRRSRARTLQLAEQKTKIEEQSAALQEAALAKARFFTNVSHELRTPVTLLNGMLEQMQEDNDSTKIKDKMNIALESSRRLQSLLGAVLDISRVDTDSVSINKRSVEVLPLLSRIVLAFESLFVKRNVTLKFEPESLRNIVAELDVDKFEKIINNLVYNAIKFNHENGWVKVSAESSEMSFTITIADSGVGITERDLPHIFDRFYQGQSGNNVEGVGIGLSLVKEFVALHGGDVSVASKLGEGTTFTLTFPLGEPTAIQADEVTAVPDVTLTEFAKATVLIVEDNDEMRFYLREILGMSVAIVEARNGREALKYLDDHTPDLIVSDVMMPEMDGGELIRRLKGSDTWKRIPVVVLTARAAEDDLLHFLGFGVDDYIVKPFNARELKIRIHNLLTNRLLRNEWNSKPVEEEEKEAVPTEASVFFEMVKDFVVNNMSNPNPGIGDLADHMAMSERQLYRKCGAVAGMTPAQLIKDVKLDIAWNSLISKKVTKVTELARSLGYENVSYFSRLFSERYGKRPVDLL